MQVVAYRIELKHNTNISAVETYIPQYMARATVFSRDERLTELDDQRQSGELSWANMKVMSRASV